jgi:polyisoprenoid-binding protein YceI
MRPEMRPEMRPVRRPVKGLVMALVMGVGLLSQSAFSKPLDYQVQPGSSLSFVGTQQGEQFTGVFKSFAAKVRMDREQPNQSLLDVSIELKSADSKNAERDAALATASWFDVAHYPTAHFKSVGFRQTAQGSVADAVLTIRDKTQRVVFPFVFKPTATGATLDAKVTLNRLDYGLGAGEWADESMVGHNVSVLVHLNLSAVPATTQVHH